VELQVKELEHVLTPRRCAHIKMPSELHANMRIVGFQKKLSLQEMFIEFARMLTDGDSYLNKKMDDLARLKKEKKIKKLTAQDSEDIYDFISKSGESS
jgi:hypothetical protein